MSQKLVQHINYLMKEKEVKLLMLQSKDESGATVPRFITSPEKLAVTDFINDRNYFALLHKPEIRAFKKIAIITNKFGVKTFLQLKHENQLGAIELVMLIPNGEDFIEITDKQQAEDYVNSLGQDSADAEVESVKKMAAPERWSYWMDKLEACTKCYACRSVCPMCYCSSCTTECNTPQWIPVATTPLGNFEWHVMRSMHLAGRCIGCDECAKVCPVNIPLNILNHSLTSKITETYGANASRDKYALNTFKPEDKAEFIK